MSDDFSHETRSSAWWSGDSRRAVSGGLVDVILEKRGEKTRDDISEMEHVRMGLVMQPAIAGIFTEVTKINTRALDIAGTHKTEPWLRCHFDFLTEDGGLLEVKNYNAAVINKYSEPDEPLRIPDADMIQCIHEATVYGCSHIYFGVLFGGQRFRHWRIDVTNDMKQEFVERAAKWWSYCHSDLMPEPETSDQARAIFPFDRGGDITATAYIEHVASVLKQIKTNIKDLEQQEENAAVILQVFMKDSSQLVNVAGDVLASWKSAKPSKKLDTKALQKQMPEVYDMFATETPGSRRFLLK